MKFVPISFSNVDAVIEPLGQQTTLDFCHDELGKITAIVSHKSLPGIPPIDPITIKSELDSGNLLELDRCYINDYQWDSALFRMRWQLSLSEAVLSVPQEPTADHEVHVVFWLTGVNFFWRTGKAEQVTLDGIDWSLSLLADTVSTAIQLRESSQAHVSGSMETVVPFSDLDRVREVANEIVLLLSFALGGRVHVAREDIYDDSGTIRVRMLKVPDNRPATLGPVPIDEAFPGLMKKYLEGTYAHYKVKESNYLLRSLVEILILARSERVLNIRALLVANGLEILRYNFAINVLVPSGRADQRNDNFHWPAGATRAGQRMSFAQILEELTQELHLTRWSTDHKDLRNSIVHTGTIPGASFWDRFSKTMEALHFCDTVILALLEWDSIQGVYIPCNQPEDPDPNRIGNNVIAFAR